MRRVIAVIVVLAVSTSSVRAAEQPEKSGDGTFVSYRDGTLTIKGKSGLAIYKQVGENYKTYENNEAGPGSRLVNTVEALARVAPGTVFRVNVENREISFGLDHRVIGSLISFEDGKLKLLAADVPQGFIKRQNGQVVLTIDAGTPVLESIDGGDSKFAGLAGEVLKRVKTGATITARSEYDPDIIEVIQIGKPRRMIERYAGQSRGTVRGSFISFKGGILRIRGKGLNSPMGNEYERVMNARIADGIPIVESIDGDEYKPAGSTDVLKTLKEGTIVTIRKVEEVVLEVQIGVPKK